MLAQLTFIFGAEGQVEGSGLEESSEGRYMFKSGTMTYSDGDSGFEISSGAYEHWLTDIREDQYPSGCRYVHVNLLTPFDKKFTIRMV